MGNHYANEAGLNHTVPMIICWEKPRLLGSLVCSTAGTHFCALSLTHFLLFFSFPYSAIFLLNFSPVSPLFNIYSCVCVCGFVFGVSGVKIASTFLHGPACIKKVSHLVSGSQHIFLALNLFYHNTRVFLGQYG